MLYRQESFIEEEKESWLWKIVKWFLTIIAVSILVGVGAYFFEDWKSKQPGGSTSAPIVIISGHRCQVVSEYRRQVYMALTVKAVTAQCDDGVAREADVDEDYDKKK